MNDYIEPVDKNEWNWSCLYPNIDNKDEENEIFENSYNKNY